MGSASISYWRSQYPDVPDGDDYALAERLSSGSYTGSKSIIVRFKSSPDGSFDTLGRADSVDELLSYFKSSSCHETEIYFVPTDNDWANQIPEALRITSEAPEGSSTSLFRKWNERLKKARKEYEQYIQEEKDRQDEEKKTKYRRKSRGECTMCGEKLSLIRRFFGIDRHPTCESFKE